MSTKFSDGLFEGWTKISRIDCHANQRVGWVERSDTHHKAWPPNDGFRKGSTHPTRLAAPLSGSWINRTQAVKIGGIEFLVRNKPHPEFICNRKPLAIQTKTKFSAVAACTSACGKNVIIFNPAPKQQSRPNVLDQSCAG